jgi:hypothetical protein
MSIAVCSLFALACLFAVLSNRDMMSPGKFYLASMLLFYIGALVEHADSQEIWLLILVVLAVGVLTVVYEAVRPAYPDGGRPIPPSLPPGVAAQPVARWIWLFSVPAILSQLYLLHHFGGLQAYINVIGNRVIEFRGLGWAKTIISTIVVLNLIYFAVGLTRRRSRGWWSAYAVHVLLLVSMGMLLGSRSAILNAFAAQLFIYHYIRRPVKMMYVIPVGALLVVFAVLLGIAREGLKVENGAIVTGLDKAENLLRLSVFAYGSQPLELLVKSPDMPIAYGSTFVSVVTNAVPRDWWPEKPDTGGVFFTKQYADDAWGGASNLTPTLLGETIINFGWAAGLISFFCLHVALMWYVVERHRASIARLRRRLDGASAVDLVLYVVVMWSIVALMIGEVTNVLLGLMLTQVIPAFAIKKMIFR